MDPDQWRKIESLYEAALGAEPARRQAFLEENCGGDEVLRHEVESLLFHGENAGKFLQAPAPVTVLEAGQHISRYEIRAKLAEGGMGAVYKAYDSQLRRLVALKVLPPEYNSDPERRERLLREARAASALNHPNIVGIHEVGSDNGMDFIAMELVEGETLKEAIPAKGLPLGKALDYAVQIARGLATAHASGVVHRDLKPGNIMLTAEGLVKLLDFGLARQVSGEQQETTLTEEGQVVGTPAYMSPEQAEGKQVDARSDLFSFGSVLYEMLAGRPAFHGTSKLSTLSSILRDIPPPLRSLRANVPAELGRILKRSLEKNRDDRYPSATELQKDLSSCLSRAVGAESASRSAWRRPGLRISVLALLLAAIGWAGLRAYQYRWVRTVALPEIARLRDNENYVAAFRLARKIDRYVPNEPELQRLRRDIWTPISIHTEPPGADVFIRDYAADQNDWELLGKSPMEGLRLPAGNFCIRITKQGFVVEEGTFNYLDREIRRTLHPSDTSPPGMVFVPVETFPAPSGAVKAGAFWLDKYEVTNRQFKEFVDRGGYRKRDYWKVPFVEKGRTLTWEEAMARFVDSTGQPGPASWEIGSFATNHEQYPVAGVSWYEAAAYADFAGKSLPTVYHWAAAAAYAHFSTILQLSNFQGDGPTRAGSYGGVGRFGTYDMAGNVSEWCQNPTGDRRSVRGGAWPDPNYMYLGVDAASPFERGPTRGLRCAKYTGPLPETLTGPLAGRPPHDYGEDKPVSDDVFRSYRSIYAYDRADLKARIESVDDSAPWWRRERVSFNAAYANDRVIAFVFLPRNAAQPYQTVVFFPGNAAQRERTSENLEFRRLDFLLRGGRAVVYPVYQGTYERYLRSPLSGPNDGRDLRIQWAKDVSRSIDYIETRADLDHERLAFFGVSGGANVGSIVSAVESRFKTSILQGGGLLPVDTDLPGEANPINFLPRVKIPILMMNGRDDFIVPVEQNQIPMFRLLGTPEKDKRHTLFDSGHALPRVELIKASLAWLDHYLGPVKPKEP